MLDTDICVFIMRGRSSRFSRRLERSEPSQIFLSCIVAAELWTGVAKSDSFARTRARLENFLSGVTILDWPSTAARLYASLRAHLERRGTPIGALDMLIAAHALHENLPLVTNNRAEFRRVPGLKVETWIR